MAENVKAVKGPGMNVRGPRPKVDNAGKILKRTLGYMMKNYKWLFAVVVVCIVATALATLSGTLFMQKLIDEYIIPMTKASNPDFGPLKKALLTLIGIYAVGVLCAFA